MKITTYRGLKIYYNKEDNTWEAVDSKDNDAIIGCASMREVEKEILKLEQKLNPIEKEKMIRVPAFVIDYDDRMSNVLVTSKRDEFSYWVSNGKKHWKQDKDELYFDTPENRKILEESKRLNKEIGLLERQEQKNRKQLKRYK
jgi:hypothetical protein